METKPWGVTSLISPPPPTMFRFNVELSGYLENRKNRVSAVRAFREYCSRVFPIGHQYNPPGLRESLDFVDNIYDMVINNAFQIIVISLPIGEFGETIHNQDYAHMAICAIMGSLGVWFMIQGVVQN